MESGITRATKIKNILAIKFSSIGDIVLTTSPIISLHKTFPEAQIDFLTLDNFAELLEGLPHINSVILFNRSAGLSELRATGKWINKEYDLIIDFHNTLRSKIIRSKIEKSKVRYLRKPRLKRFLLFRFNKNMFSADFSQIQLLNQPINEWLDNYEYPPPELYISKIEKQQAKTRITNSGIIKPYIVIIPSAAWEQKQWSSKKYVKLIKEIQLKHNLNIVILGGPKDEICTEIAQRDKKTLNLQGKTTLREALAIIANSEFVIGADTGLVHAAEALGKRVVMILGPTSRETGAGTNRKDSVTIENTDIDCRPCSQNGKRPCHRKEQYCMTNIASEYVVSKMTEAGLI